MCCKDKIPLLLAAFIVIISFMMTGCATTSTSLKFTQSEVKLIPVVAIQKVLSPRSMNETVKVRAKSVHGAAEVKGFEGQEYVIVTDERHGKEVKLAISEIVEIERIRRFTVTSDRKHQGNGAEAIGETLIYAPLIPLVIVRPLFGAMGLDEEKNSEDREKASLAYEGMSKEDLRTYIGEPKGKYHCENKDRSGAYEVWVYSEDQVLRGGRALFISLDKEKVSFTSRLFPSWKICSLITEQSTAEQSTGSGLYS